MTYLVSTTMASFVLYKKLSIISFNGLKIRLLNFILLDIGHSFAFTICFSLPIAWKILSEHSLNFLLLFLNMESIQLCFQMTDYILLHVG